MMPNSDFTNIDNFSQEVLDAAVKFKDAWREKHKANPAEYPLELPNENAGLWYEFFINFMLNGEI